MYYRISIMSRSIIHALISFNMTIKIRIYNIIVIPSSLNIIKKLHLLVDFWQHLYLQRTSVRVMVFNATFNNILTKSWRSVLLIDETRMPGYNHRPAEIHWKLYHIISHRVHLARAGFELTALVVIWTDCIGSNKSNYHHMNTTTNAP